MKEKIIEYIDFSFKYQAQQEPTLKDIHLTIYKGEKVLIIGPSGSVWWSEAAGQLGWCSHR